MWYSIPHLELGDSRTSKSCSLQLFREAVVKLVVVIVMMMMEMVDQEDQVDSMVPTIVTPTSKNKNVTFAAT